LLDSESADKLELMWRDHIGNNKSLYLPRAVENEAYDSRSDIDKAVELASKAHAADYDLDGNPTILHPLAVGMMGRNDTERIVGFLHDVVEDTKYTFDDLIEIGFSEEVIATLRLLTHDKHTPYMEYIERICKSGNRAAINVKMNDIRHNLARGREGGHMRCVEKHTIALAYIEAFVAGEAK
jgi:(p)ppGpp synthase/HD superfamily hydrolase